MSDLIITELIIGVLLFLSILRPFIKKFRGIKGIAFLPVLAAGLSVALCFAFGLRPECLPLIIFIFFHLIASLPRVISLFRDIRMDDYGEQKMLPMGFAILLLIITLIFAIRFAPIEEPIETTLFRPINLEDEQRGQELHVRLYMTKFSPYNAEKAMPILIVAPPASGSVRSVQTLCGDLFEQGYTVLSYSRPGLDIPAFDEKGTMIWPSLGNMIQSSMAFLGGSTWKTPNLMGRELENERLQDMDFICQYVHKTMKGISQDLYIIAYGSAGAAAVRYATQAPKYVRAVVTIEGPILSSLITESQRNYILETGLGPIKNLWNKGIYAFHSLQPYRVIGIGEVPKPSIPMLYIVSDRIVDTDYRDTYYATIVRSFRSGLAPAFLVSLSGAGPLEYSDMVHAYPLYRFLFPGLDERSKDPSEYVEALAYLIENFIKLAQREASIELGEDTAEAPILRKITTKANVETFKLWNSTPATDILGK